MNALNGLALQIDTHKCQSSLGISIQNDGGGGVDATIMCGAVDVLYSGYIDSGKSWSTSGAVCPFIYWRASNNNFIYGARIHVKVEGYGDSSPGDSCMQATMPASGWDVVSPVNAAQKTPGLREAST
jgi:hypothetical protein